VAGYQRNSPELSGSSRGLGEFQCQASVEPRSELLRNTHDWCIQLRLRGTETGYYMRL